MAQLGVVGIPSKFLLHSSISKLSHTRYSSSFSHSHSLSPLLHTRNHHPLLSFRSRTLPPCNSNKSGTCIKRPSCNLLLGVFSNSLSLLFMTLSLLLPFWFLLDIMSQLELGKPVSNGKPEKRVNGIFWIILINIGIFVADHFFQVPFFLIWLNCTFGFLSMILSLFLELILLFIYLCIFSRI